MKRFLLLFASCRHSDGEQHSTKLKLVGSLGPRLPHSSSSYTDSQGVYGRALGDVMWVVDACSFTRTTRAKRCLENKLCVRSLLDRR